MLHIRKHKPPLNKQLESELFTLIIRNVKLVNSITSDAQRYHKNNTNQPKNLRLIFQDSIKSRAANLFLFSLVHDLFIFYL